MQIAYASVIGEIYREELSDPVYGAYEWDYESASASHTIANPAGDNWTAEGYHYAEVDSYWVICPFGCYAVYDETVVYVLDTTEDEEEACGYPKLDKLVREYDEYPVNLDPDCDAFASSGASTHFSWSQLNGGFSNGNPHLPWGMVAQGLKNGLDYVASNYPNFAGIQLTSGYRCPHGNASIPLANSNSAHMHGRAGDLLRNGGWTEAEFNAVLDVAEIHGVYLHSDYSDYADHHLHLHF